MRTVEQPVTPSDIADQSSGKFVFVGPYDVVCGRNSTAFNNVGNRRFRVTISLNLQRYMAAKTRHERGEIILSVVKLLRDDLGARFLKIKGSKLVKLNQTEAREKVAHALRDLALQRNAPASVTTRRAQPSIKRPDENSLLSQTVSTDVLSHLLSLRPSPSKGIRTGCS